MHQPDQVRFKVIDDAVILCSDLHSLLYREKDLETEINSDQTDKQHNRRFPNLPVHMFSMFTKHAHYNGQALLLSHLIGQVGTCMDKICPS